MRQTGAEREIMTITRQQMRFLHVMRRNEMEAVMRIGMVERRVTERQREETDRERFYM